MIVKRKDKENFVFWCFKVDFLDRIILNHEDEEFKTQYNKCVQYRSNNVLLIGNIKTNHGSIPDIKKMLSPLIGKKVGLDNILENTRNKFLFVHNTKSKTERMGTIRNKYNSVIYNNY